MLLGDVISFSTQHLSFFSSDLWYKSRKCLNVKNIFSSSDTIFYFRLPTNTNILQPLLLCHHGWSQMHFPIHLQERHLENLHHCRWDLWISQVMVRHTTWMGLLPWFLPDWSRFENLIILWCLTIANPSLYSFFCVLICSSIVSCDRSAPIGPQTKAIYWDSHSPNKGPSWPLGALRTAETGIQNTSTQYARVGRNDIMCFGPPLARPGSWKRPVLARKGPSHPRRTGFGWCNLYWKVFSELSSRDQKCPFLEL